LYSCFHFRSSRASHSPGRFPAANPRGGPAGGSASSLLSPDAERALPCHARAARAMWDVASGRTRRRGRFGTRRRRVASGDADASGRQVAVSHPWQPEGKRESGREVRFEIAHQAITKWWSSPIAWHFGRDGGRIDARRRDPVACPATRARAGAGNAVAAVREWHDSTDCGGPPNQLVCDLMSLE